MLNDEVIRAVEAGDFHIWLIENIDDAIRLLTGLEPGLMQPDGSYPQGSFNQAVVEGLESLAAAGKEHTGTSEKEEMEDDDEGEN
jgi:hypothetical protein